MSYDEDFEMLPTHPLHKVLPMRANSMACVTRWTLGILAISGSAGAAVTEPDGRTVPTAYSEQNYEVPANSGNLSLAKLFSSRGETIDWQKDAVTSPSVFSPLCSFTGTLVLRGGGCKLDFGWYNVTPGVDGGLPTPPLDGEIHTLVPRTDPIIQRDFHPQVGEAGNTFTAAAIRADPNYKGGPIGFALRGNAGEECTQSHFSQPELNQVCTSCNPKGPWVTAVIYKSTATPNAYYVAFEDLPVDATRFDPGPVDSKNDGDFNDFVYFITGLTCEGGGMPCDTHKPGVCAAGITDCSPTGQQNVCRQKVDPSSEKCDNIDNDCNGKVDDGDLCPKGYVCDRGNCVFACGGGEFNCPSDLVCDRQLCVDPLCVGVDCPATQVCKAGKCIDPCTDVTCPKGQVCEKGVGRCVDVCASVKCGDGEVCEEGACVQTCACRTCPDGKACSAAGPCVDTGCETKTCDKGFVCVQGNCVDACEGAKCPGGAECTLGACGEPQDAGAADSAGTESDASWMAAGGGLNAGSGGSSGAGGAAGAPPGTGEMDASTSAGFGGGQRQSAAPAGCSCELVSRSQSRVPALLATCVLALLGLRRRPKATAPR